MFSNPLSERCRRHLDAIGQHKTALEHPCCDPAMQILTIDLLRPAARTRKLIVFELDIQIVAGETRPQPV